MLLALASMPAGDAYELFSVQALLALLTLTALETVLGIDNIVFITILTGKLPPEQARRAQRIGLLAAMVMRIALLLGITWIMQLTTPLFGLWGLELSGKDLILLIGGLVLIAKATYEIHENLEGPGHGAHESARVGTAAMGTVIAQILAVDLVFSLDSVITAVGMARHVPIMIAAIVISVGIMLLAATPVANFVRRHPTIKMLALSFLILIGVMLVADGLHQHIPRGYIYFAMVFSLVVELLNMRVRGSKPVELHRHPTLESGPKRAV